MNNFRRRTHLGPLLLVMGFVCLSVSPCMGNVTNLKIDRFWLDGHDSAFTIDTCDTKPMLHVDAAVSLHISPGHYDYRFRLLRGTVVVASDEAWLGSVQETVFDTTLPYIRTIPAVSGNYTLEVDVDGVSATSLSIPFTLKQSKTGPPKAWSLINGVSAWDNPIAVCGAGPIILDGTQSSCAAGYGISIELSDQSWTGYGGEFFQWLTQTEYQKYGGIHSFNVKKWAEDHYVGFMPGQYYRVKLAVGSPWNEHTKVISIQPSIAVLKINSKADRAMDIVGPDYPIIMDGSSSSCAPSYFLSVQLSDAQSNRYGHEAMKWLTDKDYSTYGPISSFNVKRFAEDNWMAFVPGQYYRVKLAIGPEWTEQMILIHIKPADKIEPGYTPSLRVRTHIQSKGDLVGAQGDWVGTVGQSRRMEGFEVTFSPAVPDLGLEYMAHLASLGDTVWVSAGQFVGTRNESRGLEGFAAQLTGPKASLYNVFYQCHMAGRGDSPVLSGPAFCGTRGESRSIEALRIWIVAK